MNTKYINHIGGKCLVMGKRGSATNKSVGGFRGSKGSDIEITVSSEELYNIDGLYLPMRDDRYLKIFGHYFE